MQSLKQLLSTSTAEWRWHGGKTQIQTETRRPHWNQWTRQRRASVINLLALLASEYLELFLPKQSQVGQKKKYRVWYVLWVDGFWVDVKGEHGDINGRSLAAVHLTACVSLSSSCPLMPTPGQRQAGRVVTVRAAVNQTPSPCQQPPHRCSKMEWVSQSHTESDDWWHDSQTPLHWSTKW